MRRTGELPELEIDLEEEIDGDDQPVHEVTQETGIIILPTDGQKFAHQGGRSVRSRKMMTRTGSVVGVVVTTWGSNISRSIDGSTQFSVQCTRVLLFIVHVGVFSDEI